jgi:predicted Zn-dependent peptidase
MLREFRRLSEGIEEEEVQRVRVSLKTSQIMKQESSGARAAALASDWYYLGRVRDLEEIRAAIEGITTTSILDYLRRHPPGDFTVATLGPKPLEVRAV